MKQIVGNDSAIAIISSSIKSNSVPHAYLFEGPEHVGKLTAAKSLAMSLNCDSQDGACSNCTQCERIINGTHADVELIGLDDKYSLSSRQGVISIEQVRDIQKKIALSPFEGKYRVIIFSKAENLTLEASNCLLKTLEDPPDSVVIVLLAANMGNLLSTVVSRCLLVQFKPVNINLIKDYLLDNFSINEKQAFEISRVSQGCPGWAISAMENTEVIEEFNNIIEKIDAVIKGDVQLRLEYADDMANAFKKEKKVVKDELYLWLNYWRDILLTKIGAVDLVIHNSRLDSFKLVSGQMTIDAIFRVIKMLVGTLNLLDRNVNANLAIEQFVISLPTVKSETN
ncbi:hypothetical protein OAJ59_00465 [bacterium]|nr:hypothetical protein [bacterium]